MVGTLAHAKWLAFWPMPNGWHFGPCQMVGILAHAKWLAMKISMLSPNFLISDIQFAA
jgi:hypothetical protein